MNPHLKSPLSRIVILVSGISFCFSGCRENTGGSTLSVETPEAADLGLQLEIEREMLAVERELLDLERVQLEEARNTAVSAADAAKAEAEAARAEADQARQALANGSLNTAPGELAPPVPFQGADRPRTISNGGSNYPNNNYPPVQSDQNYQGPAPDPDYSLFYEELRPHGAWFETPHYGYVWRPEVARHSPDWRPYTEGRWADTDMGWTWLSDEPFGWATYHYGRWTIVENLGWIWVPGSDWAPAWVSWRENDDHIGWAPLPPVTLYETRFDYGQHTDTVCGIPAYHYNFIPLIRFVEPVRRHCLPPVQNIQFVQYTTNVTYIHIHNQNIIVNGPRPEPLRSRFGRDRMPHHTLNRKGWSPDHSQDLSPRQDGSVLNLTAPRITAVSSARKRPSRLEGTLENLVPAHAAAKVDGDIVKRFARGRARQEVLNSGPTIAEDGTINPATKSTAGPSQPSRDVNEIRQTIAERESRIEELTKQREKVISAVKAESEAVASPGQAPVSEAPGAGQIPTQEIGNVDVTKNKKGDRDKAPTDLDNRMKELKKRQEELLSQSQKGNKGIDPNRPSDSAVVDPDSDTLIGGEKSDESKTQSNHTRTVMPERGTPESLPGQEGFPSVGREPGNSLPDVSNASEVEAIRLAKQRAEMDKEQKGRKDQEKATAQAQDRMREQQLEQQKMQEKDLEASKAQDRMREQQLEQQKMQEKALEASKAQDRMREQQLEQQKMQEKALEASKAQDRMREQQLEQQKMQEKAREASKAQDRMREQQLEQQKMQEKAREAAEAHNRKQAQEMELRQRQEQARANDEARSRMKMQEQQQQLLEQQAKEAARVQEMTREVQAARERKNAKEWGSEGQSRGGDSFRSDRNQKEEDRDQR